FNGQLIYGDRPRPEGTGKVALIDSIVGNLWTVPAGAFLQGQWFFEPCAGVDDDRPPFVHELTRDLVVMETEVTRGMWAALRDLQPELPTDPAGAAEITNREPVSGVTWYEAVLFANLLSIQQGLTPCYYADSMFSAPLTAAYYQTDDVYCNFDADGFRLPTEGEWEYFCRAGTTGPFWVDEPNYHDANCDTDFCWAGLWPNLEDAAVFCANSLVIKSAQVVGTKRSNPWGLKDIHGNVAEWCWDWYGPYPSAVVDATADKGAVTNTRVTDFMGPYTGEFRIIRGGSYDGMPWSLVSPGREYDEPSTSFPRLGFRLVRTNRF
ncbi:MAG: SUMF1/EgtB/PvdO family nonheme iron enzyme, partial [Acidobacteria bacterium]|nr:SUMF1/EgtB/PvdO family nonheme iron enzyme [Acidobacteriota bacterium]